MLTDRDYLYNEANDTGNKEPVVEVFLPSMVWNRSYLLPKRSEFDPSLLDDDGRRETIAQLKDSIDEAIIRFLHSSQGVQFETLPDIDGDIVLFASAYVAAAHPNRFVKIVSPSIKHRRIIDVDERAVVLRGNYTDKEKVYLISIRVHVRTNLFTVSIVATPTDHLAKIDLKNDYADLTFLFWRRFYRSVMRTFRPERHLGKQIFRSVFADSRGVILSSTAVGGGDTPFDPAVDWAEPIIGYVAPVLSPDDEKGCTATYLLNRRVVTLTTFGAGSAVPTPYPGRKPLVFVMCLHGGLLPGHEQGWARQMGHVLSRSHTISTMRLAALVDIRLLRIASAELAKVDDLKRRARERMLSYEKDEVEAGKARQALDNLRRHFNKISSDFLERNAAGVGLTFRIESSRYYIEEFKKQVEALKLSPIDGYQSYSQSIERNIELPFEFINRLGIRYDRLLKEMTSIEQNFASIQSHYTGNLIAEIQRNGEFILVGALVPYYIISTVNHILGEHSEHQSALRSRLTEPGWASFFVGIWSTLVFIAAYRAIFSRFKAAYLKKAWQHYCFLLLTIVVWAATTSSLCVYVKNNSEPEHQAAPSAELIYGQPLKASGHPSDMSPACKSDQTSPERCRSPRK